MDSDRLMREIDQRNVSLAVIYSIASEPFASGTDLGKAITGVGGSFTAAAKTKRRMLSTSLTCIVSGW